VFLQSVGVSLTELFDLVSNVWYVEIVVQSIIGDVARCVDNDSEVFVLKFLNYFYVRIGGCAPKLNTVIGLRIALYSSNLLSIDSCDLLPIHEIKAEMIKDPKFLTLHD